MRWGLFILIVLAYGCNYTNKQQKIQLSLRTAIENLKNDTLPLHKKISIALAADSIAERTNNDSTSLNLQQQLAELYLEKGSTEKAKEYFLRSLKTAGKINDHLAFAKALNNIGYIYDDASNSDSAIKYYDYASRVFLKYGEKYHYAQNLVNLAIVLKNNGAYEKAFDLNLEALRILSDSGSKRDLSDAYTTMGNILKSLNRIGEALEYHKKALDLRKSEHDSIGIAGSLNNIGNLHRYNKKYQEALRNYKLSLLIKEKIGSSKTVAITLDNIGEVYLEEKQLDSAKQYFLSALKLRRETADKDGFITTSNRLCKLFLELHDFRQAESIALQVSRVVAATSLRDRLDNAILMSAIYEGQDDLHRALKFANLSLTLKDSLFNSQMAGSVSEMQAKYEAELKQRTIKEQQIDIELQRNKNLLLVGGIALAACLIIFISISYFNLKRQKRIIVRQKDEIVHNNRNNIQQLISIFQRQAENEEQGGKAVENQERLFTLNLLNRLLYEDVSHAPVDLQRYLQELCNAKETSYNLNINLETKLDDSCLSTGLVKDIGLIVNELTTNSAKHGHNDSLTGCSIFIRATVTRNGVNIEYRDNGKGMPNSLKDTRGSFGLNFIDDLVSQHHGTWRYYSDNGACFQIYLRSSS